MDSIYHNVNGRIEELLGIFRVEVFDQLGGVFDVGKQYGDLLPFAFEGTAGGQNLFGQVGWCVGMRGTHGCLVGNG